MKIIETRSRSNLFSYLGFGIGAFLVLVAPFGMILSVANPLDGSIFNFLIYLIQFLFGLMCLRNLVWFVTGIETLSVMDNKIILQREGTFWIKRHQEIPLSEVNKVCLHQSFIENQLENNGMQGLVRKFSREIFIFKIQNVGRIKIELKDKESFYFLDGISIPKADKIIQQLIKIGG